jgi:hypothetical protein
MNELITTGLDTSTIKIRFENFIEWSRGSYSPTMIGEKEWYLHLRKVGTALQKSKSSMGEIVELLQKYIALINASRYRIHQYSPIWISLMEHSIAKNGNARLGNELILSVIRSMSSSLVLDHEGTPVYVEEENLLWREWDKLMGESLEPNTMAYHDGFKELLALEVSVWASQEVSQYL